MAKLETLKQLEAVYGPVNVNSIAKQTATITAEYRALIEAAPFVALATAGPGGLDCSPRGDREAAVTVVDDRTIHLPDRRGNNRIDSLRNIVVDPRVGLLFLIPGLSECMRVNGTAELRTDPELCARYVVDGKAPVTVIVITTDEVYFQCARAIKRSELWNPDRQVVDRSTLPTAGEVMAAIDEGFDGEAYDRELPERQANTLY